MDVVIGRLRGMVLSIYQCHIRASPGRDGVENVSLDLIIGPGVWPALTTVVHSCTVA